MTDGDHHLAPDVCAHMVPSCSHNVAHTSCADPADTRSKYGRRNEHLHRRRYRQASAMNSVTASCVLDVADSGMHRPRPRRILHSVHNLNPADQHHCKYDRVPNPVPHEQERAHRNGRCNDYYDAGQYARAYENRQRGTTSTPRPRCDVSSNIRTCGGECGRYHRRHNPDHRPGSS